ncbi:hypothetical protein DXG01_014966 [Tephrocybe rancida]|nr:hypothetical protein DXG01_014966 [Tephrocybe rancida]
MGGYPWRLCLPFLSFESVLQGPTLRSNPAPDSVFKAREPKTGTIFVDDKLTDIETRLLSGTNAYFTGKGVQMADRSWYPSVRAFAMGEDFGRWAKYKEHYFNTRAIIQQAH